MIELPPPNTRAHPYRGLSVQEVDVEFTADAVRAHLVGREVYRRTEFLALVNGEDVALAAVRKASTEPLFSEVTDARLLTGPDATMWIDEPDADVGNATTLARVAAAHARPGVRAFVVRGRFEHVNFIFDPAPVRVRVLEVVPPSPPKLAEQARAAVAFDEDLPPVELVVDTVAIRDLAATAPADAYLLPCRGSGAELLADVAYLDTRPAVRGDWTMVGCERSLQFHRHFYGDEPPRVDICPVERLRAEAAQDLPVLAKCCLRERGVEIRGAVATVPWGANLDEVRAALRLLTDVEATAVVDVDRPAGTS